MSYQDNRWCTKSDILKDLAEVTGRISDVDDIFIVKGEKPPPRRRFEEDDVDLRFQDNFNNGDATRQDPDLNGIMQMLRLVNESENTEESFIGMKKVDQIVISKLNPDVPDFIPKRQNSPSNTLSPKKKTSDKVANKKIKCTRTQRDNNNSPSITCKEDCFENEIVKDAHNEISSDCRSKDNASNMGIHNYDISNNKIDISELDADQIKSITTKLRNKISDASNKDDLRLKREKNVAIATLLKLYSTMPLNANATNLDNVDSEIKPIKLFTPEYFESTRVGTSLETKQKVCEINGTPVSTSSESSIRSTPENTELHISPDTETIEVDITETIKETKQSNNEVTESYSTNPVICNSINKVNDWFTKPASPKPVSNNVYLGPIIFKKKSSTAKSSVSDRCTPTNNVAVQIPRYKPSKYAENLGKKFTEQGEASKRQNLDVWKQAQIQMKAKEEAMKSQKSLEQSNDSLGDQTDNS